MKGGCQNNNSVIQTQAPAAKHTPKGNALGTVPFSGSMLRGLLYVPLRDRILLHTRPMTQAIIINGRTPIPYNAPR
jgi:hypothetical protein